MWKIIVLITLLACIHLGMTRTLVQKDKLSDLVKRGGGNAISGDFGNSKVRFDGTVVASPSGTFTTKDSKEIPDVVSGKDGLSSLVMAGDFTLEDGKLYPKEA